MTRGEDKWQAFCEASRAWRKAKKTQAEDANVDPEATWEDQPHASDEEQEVFDEATIAEAARQPVPFGFEATGERDVLMRERRIRQARRAEGVDAKEAQKPAIWDEDAADSEATEEWQQDEEWQQGDAEQETQAGEGAADDDANDDAASGDSNDDEVLFQNSAEVLGSRYFERQSGAACGQHALNNLVGRPQYLPNDMVEACEQVVQEVGDPAAEHRCGRGWYSFSVLGRVL